ncbi:carboxypeptidase-like regulatory domain-containing protein [Algoriphagus sp. D3-2-R+10]|uniref:carboxypeptidase-like regulatory domain-containing protein n=1 Tax=Algoriphagus aurantiacus TaxID=3103948 RepID=UPI002B3EDB2B|nr:carboxypeptidase-like regulatory domain-containing protein [Algoriphagus sp. D3-2-R+10]MEB2778071.1 carboxypeptidase-like regulatory domain-containing protein [Algoriphagus sp. D3-2-R+10]
MLKRIVLGLFLFLGSFSSFAQAIFKGTVADNETGKGIPFATVFLANTTIGTSTDEEGKFSIYLSEGNYEVIIRMLGYEGLTFNLPAAIVKPQGYKFMLVPIDEELSTLNVNDKRDPVWYRNLADFKKYFLGTSLNGKACVIENELSMILDDQSEPGSLIASSRDILKIENPNLGYRLDYLLNDFRFNYKQGFVTYGGYPLFTPDSTLSRRKQRRVEKNRLEAYYGSLQHFLRAVYSGTTVSEGFEIRRLFRKDDPVHSGKIDSVATDLITSIDIRKNRERREYLEFDGHLLITYLNERESPHYIMGLGRGIRNYQTSIIRLTVQHLEVFENGSLSDPFGLVVEVI